MMVMYIINGNDGDVIIYITIITVFLVYIGF